MNKAYTKLALSVIALTFAGCGGGAVAGLFGSAAGAGGAGAAATGVGAGVIGGAAIAATHAPEPMSMLLFGSGLIGMAIYAKTRLKAKKK